MVWGAFSGQGPLELHRVQGTLTARGYVMILEDKVEPFFESNPAINFQQDNATPHKARLTMNWFQEHGIQVMPWPAYSPDLNPMENIWSFLKSKLDSQVIHGMHQLFEVASGIIRDIPADFITSLMESMPRRCQQVIDRHGRSTDY